MNIKKLLLFIAVLPTFSFGMIREKSEDDQRQDEIGSRSQWSSVSQRRSHPAHIFDAEQLIHNQIPQEADTLRANNRSNIWSFQSAYNQVHRNHPTVDQFEDAGLDIIEHQSSDSQQGGEHKDGFQIPQDPQSDHRKQRVFTTIRKLERPRYHFGFQAPCRHQMERARQRRDIAAASRQLLFDLGKDLLNESIYEAHSKVIALENNLPQLTPRARERLLPYLAKYKQVLYNLETGLLEGLKLSPENCKDFVFAYCDFLFEFCDKNSTTDHIKELCQEHNCIWFHEYLDSRGFLSGVRKPKYPDLSHWKSTEISKIQENQVIAETYHLQKQGRINQALEHGKEYLANHPDLKCSLLNDQKRLQQSKEQRAQREQRIAQEQEQKRLAKQQALEAQRLEALAQPLEKPAEKYSLTKEELKQQLIDEGKIVCDDSGRIIECKEEVLHQYNHYQFRAYRELLEEIPGFDKAIRQIQNRLKTDTQFKQRMQDLQGFTKQGFERQIKSWGARVDVIDQVKQEQGSQLSPAAQREMVNELFEGYKKEIMQQTVETEMPKMQKMHTALQELIEKNAATPEQIRIYNAIDQILNGEIVWKTKQFDLTLDAHQTLVEQGVDPQLYEECCGHQLQQEVHELLVKDINKWAALKHAMGKDSESVLSTMITELSGLGIMANHLAKSPDAMTFADCCHQFLEIIHDGGQKVSDAGFPQAGTIIKVDANILKAFADAVESCRTGDYQPFLDGIDRLGWHSLVKPLKGVYELCKNACEEWVENCEYNSVSQKLMDEECKKWVGEWYGESVQPEREERISALSQQKKEMDQVYQQRRDALWQSIDHLADKPTRELIADGTELAADIAIAELTFVALSKGLSVASKTAEEFEVTARPSKQTLKKAQGELAQAKRPLFTTPEGEAFEVAGLVEEEASSATSLAKDTQKGKGKLPRSAPKYASAKLDQLLSNFAGKQFKIGRETFILDKKGLKHILKRHHPKYWHGVSKNLQSFVVKKETIDAIVKKIQIIMNQNREILLKRGTNGRYSIKGVINGVTYKVGFTNGRIGQFYPNLK